MISLGSGEMTNTVDSTRADLLREAARRATLAPSVHNTQPWRISLKANTLELYADRSRRLLVLDPTGRQLVISCGCALFNARAALELGGYDAIVERFPDDDEPDLLARITLPAEGSDRVPIGELDSAIGLRQTNRRQFMDEPVSPDLVCQMIEAANAEGASIFPVTTAEHRLITARLSQQADGIQNADPAYRAELRAWTSYDPNRHDGVPAMAVPHVDGGANDDIPIRDFDTHGMGWLPVETRSSMNHCLLLLGTRDDSAEAWLRAGEALERLWLVATRSGYVASLLTQVLGPQFAGM